jgi:hypothetical protein
MATIAARRQIVEIETEVWPVLNRNYVITMQMAFTMLEATP